MRRRHSVMTMAVVSAIAACTVALAAPKGPVKVFLLAGQSNMEGKAAVSTLDAWINYPETHEQYKHLKPDGKWLVRDDVWVTYLDRNVPEGTANHGPLTVGFGSLKPNKQDRSKPIPCIGPELGIGLVLGDHLEEPVLLIKAAWGGKSVKHSFLPPSEMPSEDEIRAKHAEILNNYEEAKHRYAEAKKRHDELKAAGKPARKVKTPREPPSYEDYKNSIGLYYRKMLAEYRKVVGEIEKYVPYYDREKGFELAGLIWFQGWNDGCGAGNPKYTGQMASLIRDVRNDLKAPELPVVIGELGVDGTEPMEWVATFRKQQADIAALPEFRGAVRLAKTAHCQYKGPYDMSDKWAEFQRLSEENSKRPPDDPTKVRKFYKEMWVKKYAKELAFTSDKRYHYGGSGRTYYGMGRSMGNAMVELLESRP